MKINRRRAPSTQISRDKKLGGHQKENEYAEIIGGKKIGGTEKGDVRDQNGLLHSVKSGKKWQVFLYSYNRICSSKHLKILQPCLEAFTMNSQQYFADRVKCISYKEKHVRKHGRNLTKMLSNETIKMNVGMNTYIQSKENLAAATIMVCDALRDKFTLRNFLDEALFNTEEVDFLAVKDSTYKRDDLFKVFKRDYVLDVLTNNLFPNTSRAGRVPEDYNIHGQKTLLCYTTNKNTPKNIVEIEIRNDSDVHYRQVRFNMYSRDTLYLLLNAQSKLSSNEIQPGVLFYGEL
jgi:hypothetical protein